MRASKHETIMETDADGVPKIYDRALFLDFFAQNPNEKFQVTVKRFAKNKSKGLLGYYWAEVVIKYQRGLLQFGNNFTQKETHEFMKTLSPVMEKPVELGDRVLMAYRGLSDEDFTNQDFKNYIDDLVRWAATEMSVIINDPS